MRRLSLAPVNGRHSERTAERQLPRQTALNPTEWAYFAALADAQRAETDEIGPKPRNPPTATWRALGAPDGSARNPLRTWDSPRNLPPPPGRLPIFGTGHNRNSLILYSVMRIRIPEIEIADEQPYANDLLHRRAFGDALANILKNAQSEFTLAIDGQWGDGKTTFARMWCEQLKADGFHAIYFDAFVNDHGQDPFAPLSAVLLDAIRPDVETTSKETTNRFATMGLKLLQIGSRVALRIVTAGAIDEKDIKEISDALTSNKTDAALGEIEKRLAEYHISESELNEFRSLLSELAQPDDTELPLVIILDELDRCRPTFALSLLEKVKHFFSVEGIVFVFVMNTEQMCACIHHVYGSSIDARQYLHKFVDVECALPAKRRTGRNESLYTIYAEHLIGEYELHRRWDSVDIRDLLVALADTFTLSLRDMQKACRTVALFYEILEEREWHISSLVCLLSVLRACDRTTYNDLANNVDIDLKPIVDKLQGSIILEYTMAWLLVIKGRENLMPETSKVDLDDIREMIKSSRRQHVSLIDHHCAKMDYFR